MTSDTPGSPTTAQEYIDLPPDPPSWPKAVGVLSIVFASIGLACVGCGGVGLVMQAMFSGQAETQMGAPMPDVMKPGIVQLVSMPLGAILAALLLIAGIMLLRRNKMARPLHLVYGAISTILSIVSSIAGFQQVAAMREWAQANPDSPWAAQVNPDMNLVFMIVGMAIGFAWPVFCLIWFGLVKRRASDIGELREVL